MEAPANPGVGKKRPHRAQGNLHFCRDGRCRYWGWTTPSTSWAYVAPVVVSEALPTTVDKSESINSSSSLNTRCTKNLQESRQSEYIQLFTCNNLVCVEDFFQRLPPPRTFGTPHGAGDQAFLSERISPVDLSEGGNHLHLLQKNVPASNRSSPTTPEPWGWPASSPYQRRSPHRYNRTWQTKCDHCRRRWNLPHGWKL